MTIEKQTDQRVGGKARLRALAALVVLAVVVAMIYVGRPEERYLWAKALHIIAVISWMAGLLYMPRLFIYHTDAEPGTLQSETFKVMEQRLLKVIMNPAMMLTWLLGLYLAWMGFQFQGGWLHAKFGAVLLLTLFHIGLSRAVRSFARDEKPHTARYWRLMNEVPTVLMIVIVILVVVKPF